MKKYLEEKKCLVCVVKAQNGDIVFSLPERQIKPVTPAVDTVFRVEADSVSIKTNGESQGKIPLPPYAIRPFVMSVVVASCERFGYDKDLIKFDIGGQETDHVTFSKQMLWFPLEPEDEQKDHLLRSLVTNAMNCPIKFHSDFDTRAIELGIDDGYQRVKHILRGGNVYE